MKVTTAAEIIGASPMFVREMCKRGILGESYGSGKQRKSYEVSPARLASWLGITTEELKRKMEEMKCKED